jgi:hypothetical protein
MRALLTLALLVSVGALRLHVDGAAAAQFHRLHRRLPTRCRQTVPLQMGLDELSQPLPLPLPLLKPAVRDIVAEANAAAALLRRDVLPLASSSADATAQRQLVTISMRRGTYQQLVGEVVSHITSGSRAGTTWLRPLALRSVANATLAAAAEKFDPSLGWLGSKPDSDAAADGEGDDGDGDIVPSHIYLFSALAPAAFIETGMLADAPPTLAVAVRTLHNAHDAAALEADFDDAAAHRADHAALHSFMMRVYEKQQEQEGVFSLIVRPRFPLWHEQSSRDRDATN